MLRDRPKPGSRNSAGSRRRKAPFPRILSEVSSSTLPAIRRAPGRGVEALHPTGPPAGAAVPPADRCRSRSQQGLRTCTDCSGSGFRDKLAHRIAIQAPQQWLHSGTLERHRGSPPSPGLAPKRQTLIRTGENRTGGFGFSQRSQHAGAISHSSVTRIQLTDSAVAGTPPRFPVLRCAPGSSALPVVLPSPASALQPGRLRFRSHPGPLPSAGLCPALGATHRVHRWAAAQTAAIWVDAWGPRRSQSWGGC
jgi:hypothetical protein